MTTIVSRKMAFLGTTVFVVASGVAVYGLASAQTPESSAACDQRVTLLNNRSILLENYKKTEDKKYKVKREKSAKRIAYASQWVKSDAEVTRDSLYELDAKHRTLTAEIDKQINDYAYLKAAPLDCSSDANRQQVKQKLEEVKGIQDRKAAGGQALIEKLKNEETQFENTKLNDDMKKLIRSLHKTKEKNPAPKEQGFEIKQF